MSGAIPDVLDGRVAWIFEDDFDVDLVVGVAHMQTYDPVVLAPNCMVGFDPRFPEDVRKGDLLVAGENFGYGHPHPPAMIAMRELGIAAVLAESFAPAFFFGETYEGMPLIVAPGLRCRVRRWDRVQVDWRAGTLQILRTAETVQTEKPAPHVQRAWEAGGVEQYLLKEGTAGL